MARKKRSKQKDDSAPPGLSAIVIGLWREIMLVEPDTCPWKFACAMANMRHIDARQVWKVAEWADAVRENVRQLRLKGIVRNIQDIAKQLS